MKTKVLLVGVMALILTACGGNTNSSSTIPVGMTEEEYESYKSILSSVQTIEQTMPDIDDMTDDEALKIVSLSDQLFYDYDPMGKDSTTLAACGQLKLRVQKLKSQINATIATCLPKIRVDVVNSPDHLVDKAETYPVYLKRGDTLYTEITAERTCTLKIYNADAKSCLLTRTGKSQYSEKLAIRNSAIYLVEITSATSQYADIQVKYGVSDISRLNEKIEVESEEVEAKAGDWRARGVKGIKMKNLFEEPRKFTLRGQLKAAFSGSYRALVAVQVPAGATDILYSLRISTNESNRRSDGEFYDNMETSYKKVKMLGLPVYESHKGGGLIATLLGENIPVREEDAYINMYVFYSSALAKRFQDGADPAKLAYNVDYSTLGTQSCNGRIPSKGNRTIYLAFENERMRYNNYIWLEAVSAVPHTEYYKVKYTLK